MPTLNLNLLIKALTERQRRLYELYINIVDISLSDTLLYESQALGQIIDQLKKLKSSN
jgi:hypothetical protein